MSWDDDQKKCGGLTAFGLFTLLISGAMIVIGAMNMDWDAKDPVEQGSCRVNPRISVFLLGGGIVFLLLLLLRFIFQRVCRKCGECCGGDNKLCNSLNFAANFSCILLYDILAFIVVLAVLIYGAHEVSSVWDQVDYDASESSSSYCPEYLYTFSYVLLIVLFVLLLFSLVCGLLAKFCACFYNILCCRPCRGSDGENQAV